MTVSSPNIEARWSYITRWAGLVCVVAVVVVMVANSGLTDLKRAVAQRAKEVDQLTATIADLKNEWYARTETKALIAAVEKGGYVRDGRPRYMTFDQLGRVVRGDSSVSINR